MESPSLKAEHPVRFYNPGDHLSEPLTYTIPGDDIHCVARFIIEADEKSFFKVPTSLRFVNENIRVGVDFVTTVCQKFKGRGIIMIDPEATDEAFEDDELPIARTDKEATEKGNRILAQYNWTIYRRWEAQCNEIKQKGGVPEPASGYTKRVLRVLNLRDPALTAQAAIQQAHAAPAGSSDEMQSLRDQNAATQDLVKALMAKLEAKEALESADKVEKAVSAKAKKQS